MIIGYRLSFLFFFFVLKLRFFFYLAPWTCPRSINSVIIRHDVANNEFILREEAKEKKEKKKKKERITGTCRSMCFLLTADFFVFFFFVLSNTPPTLLQHLPRLCCKKKNTRVFSFVVSCTSCKSDYRLPASDCAHPVVKKFHPDPVSVAKKKTHNLPRTPNPDPRKLDRDQPRGKVLLLRDRRGYENRVSAELVREIEKSLLATQKTDRGYHLSDRKSFVHRSQSGPRSKE